MKVSLPSLLAIPFSHREFTYVILMHLSRSISSAFWNFGLSEQRSFYMPRLANASALPWCSCVLNLLVPAPQLIFLPFCRSTIPRVSWISDAKVLIHCTIVLQHWLRHHPAAFPEIKNARHSTITVTISPSDMNKLQPKNALDNTCCHSSPTWCDGYRFGFRHCSHG